MALTIIVENGTGLENANSYIDAQYAAEYAESIGSDAWDNNCDMHTVALIQSARFLDMRYASRFRGHQLNPEQALQYPRSFAPTHCGAPTESPIPRALKNAQAALAIQYIEDGGVLDLNANATNMVSSESVSVGNGAVSQTQSYFRPREQSAFSVADAYIRQVTKNYNSAFVPIVRG